MRRASGPVLMLRAGQDTSVKLKSDIIELSLAAVIFSQHVFAMTIIRMTFVGRELRCFIYLFLLSRLYFINFFIRTLCTNFPFIVLYSGYIYICRLTKSVEPNSTDNSSIYCFILSHHFMGPG